MKTVFFGRKPHGGFCGLAAVLLAVSVCGTVLAEEEGAQSAESKKFSVSLDTAPLFKGLVTLENEPDGLSVWWGIAARFEYALLPQLSAGIRTGFYLGEYHDVTGYYIGVTAHGRWYAFGNAPDKLFVDGLLGFNMENWNEGSDKYGEKLELVSGLTFGMGIGWKIYIKKGFFAEPSIYYMYSKEGVIMGLSRGWQPALCAGISF